MKVQTGERILIEVSLYSLEDLDRFKKIIEAINPQITGLYYSHIFEQVQ